MSDMELSDWDSDDGFPLNHKWDINYQPPVSYGDLPGTSVVFQYQSEKCTALHCETMLRGEKRVKELSIGLGAFDHFMYLISANNKFMANLGFFLWLMCN